MILGWRCGQWQGMWGYWRRGDRQQGGVKAVLGAQENVEIKLLAEVLAMQKVGLAMVEPVVASTSIYVYAYIYAMYTLNVYATLARKSVCIMNFHFNFFV